MDDKTYHESQQKNSHGKGLIPVRSLWDPSQDFLNRLNYQITTYKPPFIQMCFRLLPNNAEYTEVLKITLNIDYPQS